MSMKRPVSDVYKLSGANDALRLKGKWWMTSIGGLGLGGVNWQTLANGNVGERVTGYRLPPRQINLSLVRASLKSNRLYRQQRERILDLLQPNNADPLTLRVAFQNGNTREIAVRYGGGLEFDEALDSDSKIETSLSLVAHNPIWTDTAKQVQTMTSNIGGGFFFPMEWDMQWGGAGLGLAVTINYTGRNLWFSYPKITLNGPYTSAALTNALTGVSIRFHVPILIGQQRIISITDAGATITDQNGINRFNELDPAYSRLLDFYLRPNTSQQVGVSFGGATDGVTSANVEYQNKYIAI